MSMAVSTRLLNPSEIEAIVRDEKDRRRLLRLDQVRSRSRLNASKILLAVKNERQHQLQLLRKKLEEEWRKGKREKLNELGTQYGKCLLHIGDAHQAVEQEEKAKVVHPQQREQREIRASSRGRDALAKLSSERAQVHQRLLDRNSCRELVRQAEDERAKQLASLPRPQSTVTPLNASSGALELESSVTPVAVTCHDATDAREAARNEEERRRIFESDRGDRETEKSALDKERFLEARAKMELQKKYNRIMDELDKIAEAEKSREADEKIVQHDPQTKRKLIAEQEAVVEELLNKLSIPAIISSTSSASESLVSATESTSSYLMSDDSTDTIVNHVLVSVDEWEGRVESLSEEYSTSKPIVATVPKLQKVNAPLADETSSSSSSSYSINPASIQRKLSAGQLFLPVDDNEETILASHPNAKMDVSSLGIDLSSYAFEDNESSTKWPQSTVDTNDLCRATSEDDDDNDDEDTTEKQSRMDKSGEQEHQALSKRVEEPQFRNAEIATTHPIDPVNRDPNLESAARVPRKEAADNNEGPICIDPNRMNVDRASYLRRLLSLAVKNRAGCEVKNEIPIKNIVHQRPNSSSSSASSSSSKSRSPVAVSASGLADLKEAFRIAEASLRTELEARNRRMENAQEHEQQQRDKRERFISNRGGLGDCGAARRPTAALSTIMEADTSIDRDSFGSRWPSMFKNEKGITDEPDLTLVGSETSSAVSTPRVQASSSSLKAKPMDDQFHLLRVVQSDKPIQSVVEFTRKSDRNASRVDPLQKLSKLSTPSFFTLSSDSNSSTETWSSCFSDGRIHRKLTPAMISSALDLSDDDDSSVATVSKSQKSICLSHFFDSETSDERGGLVSDSCPLCRSSISDSDSNGQKVSSTSVSSSAPSSLNLAWSVCDDSLNSFLRHEMSANNATSFSFSAPSGSANSSS